MHEYGFLFAQNLSTYRFLQAFEGESHNVATKLEFLFRAQVVTPMSDLTFSFGNQAFDVRTKCFYVSFCLLVAFLSLKY